MVDLIIPVYNSRKTLGDALGSILAQTVHNDINVIICDDYSSEDYSDILEPFYKLLNIKYIKLDKNSGPSIARKVGIENSTDKYVSFMDSDDIFLSNYFIEEHISVLEKNDDIKITIANYYIETETKHKWVEKQKDFVHIFAKVYRRKFIEENEITFPDFRYNEDVAFNTLCMGCLPPNEGVFHDNNFVYLWKRNMDSITRSNWYNFYFGENMVSWADNKMWALSSNKINKDFAISHSLASLFATYYFYMNVVLNKPEYSLIVLTKFKEFYRKFGKSALLKANDDIKNKLYVQQSRECSFNVAHIMTFNDYIKKLEK